MAKDTDSKQKQRASVKDFDLPLLDKSDISYQSFPKEVDASARVVWRIRLVLAGENPCQVGYDLNGEAIIGRDLDVPNLIDVYHFTDEVHGLSRQHMMLRPTESNLYAIDLGSTNGTYRNGRRIGINNPYPLRNKDQLELGDLTFVIYIESRPAAKTTRLLSPKMDLGDAMAQIGQALTSQLNLEQVLNEVVDTAQHLTTADESAIWLMDEISGELFLKAEKGISEERIREMRLSLDSLPGQVLQNEKPFLASRAPGEERIKIKTGYLMESLAYVPIMLGGVTLGVLGAGQREKGKKLTERDEKLLETIADFAAIAIQNARLYEATDAALARRVKELRALNELTHTVSSSLDLAQVYRVLIEQIHKNWQIGGVQLYLKRESQQSLYELRLGKDAPKPSPIRSGLLWEVAETQESLVSNEASSHPKYDPKVDQHEGQPPRSIAAIPLTSKDRLLGVLALYDKEDGKFDDDDMQRLAGFSNPVATAIANARLFAETRRQQAAIQATAQTVHQPLIILDERGRVIISNQAAEEILDQHMSALFNGISEGIGSTTELTIGEKSYLTTSQHIKNVGTFIVMQDITYVKQLEKDRADFMHALSHDLKSPLTSIKGFAQLLEKVATLNEKGAHFIYQIISAADRMLDMVNQLLQVARADIIELEEQPVRLDEVVQEVITHVEGSALHKQIDIDYQPSGDPYTITGDRTRLYHMVLNLIDNAIKYSPANTQVMVQLEFQSDQIWFNVEDEGPGIPPTDLNRVFDKYYRGDQAKAQPGAGLGLSVVWATAQAHGGRATVRNLSEDGGAAFTVTLPKTHNSESMPASSLP